MPHRRRLCTLRALVSVKSAVCVLSQSRHTCPPEKPTATRPKSLAFLRNFGCIVGASILASLALYSPIGTRLIMSIPRFCTCSVRRKKGEITCSTKKGSEWVGSHSCLSLVSSLTLCQPWYAFLYLRDENTLAPLSRRLNLCLEAKTACTCT